MSYFNAPLNSHSDFHGASAYVSIHLIVWLSMALLHDPMARPLSITHELIKTQTRIKQHAMQLTELKFYLLQSQSGGLPNSMLSVHLGTAVLEPRNSLLVNRTVCRALCKWPSWL